MENNATFTKDSITAVEAKEIKDELAASGVEISVDYTDTHLNAADNGNCFFVEFGIAGFTDEKIAAFENALAKRGVELHVANLEDKNGKEREEEVQNRGVFHAVKEVYGTDICISVPIDGLMDINAVEVIDEETPDEVLDELVSQLAGGREEYTLPVVELKGGTYLIAKDEEAAKDAAHEYIENTIWSFSADFLAGETGIDSFVFETLAEKCEDAQDGVLDIVEATCGLDTFVADAIAADGIGHFLAFYDGNEIEAGKHRVYRRD